MGPYQRTPKEVARAIRFPGLGVRSVGPVGDFLEFFHIWYQHLSKIYQMKFQLFDNLNFWGVKLFTPTGVNLNPRKVPRAY